MRVEQVARFLDEWAPKFIQWERDNTGLLVGDSRQKVTGVLVCLDVTGEALEQAQKLRCNLVISHHPLIFSPMKKITPETDRTSKLVTTLIKNDISLLSYHTNLDFTHNGVNHQLAQKLELTDHAYLVPISGKRYKLVVFTPENSLDKVSEAIFSAGGGVIGEYSKCSYRSKGTGTFIGSDQSNPAVGAKEKFEAVEETRLEVVINEANLGKSVKAMLAAHPYEEPAYDIYPLKNAETNYGMGVTGTLPRQMTEHEFLQFVATKLGTGFLRHSAPTGKKVKKIAVFGGSASEYLSDAIAAGCDAFVTSDIRYHSFQDAEGKILFVDAGHFETEVLVLQEVKKRLEGFFTSISEETSVFIYDGSANPVNYFSL